LKTVFIYLYVNTDVYYLSSRVKSCINKIKEFDWLIGQYDVYISIISCINISPKDCFVLSVDLFIEYKIKSKHKKQTR